jgi:hypothetical protein
VGSEAVAVGIAITGAFDVAGSGCQPAFNLMPIQTL